MRWLRLWRSDLAALRALEPGRDPLLDILVQAAIVLVLLADVLALALWLTGPVK